MKKEKRKTILNKLSTGKKIQLVAIILLVIASVGVIPTFAWFSNRKQAATMAKVNSPAKLSIKSGNAEDIIQFEMSNIDVGNGSEAGEEYFVFCVEGEDVSKYNLQIAHTTNINFTYTLYRAHSDNAGMVVYKDKDQAIHRYRKADEFVDNENANAYGGYIYAIEVDGRLMATNNYTEESYSDSNYADGSGTNHVQYYAEPLYWQTKASIQANALDDSIPYNEYTGEENRFLNYFVLEVSWGAGDIPDGNSKETDLIYITAQVD